MQKQRKIVVMGSRSVGKSSITVQFVDNHFVDTYNPTIENTFHKTINYKGVDFTTDIIDTPGQDEHSIFNQQYAVGIHGYILVYSINSKFSFELVKTLNDKILNETGLEKVPRVLVANKSDLTSERIISLDQGRSLAKQWNCGFVECSAKFNTNIAQVFAVMLEEIEKVTGPTKSDSPCILC